MRYLSRIAYNGGKYSGWQKQQNVHSTVQETIEKALSTIAQADIQVVGCGRTDAGVHARDFVLHFNSEFDFENLVFKVNSLLPQDIVFYSLEPCTEEFHARFDAVKRTYHYYIHTRKNPFLQGLSFEYRRDVIDLELMNLTAAHLLNYTDFTTFCKTGSDVDNCICTLSESHWEKIDEYHFRYTISANRFLRGMVRLIVGMCIHVHDGKMSIGELISALENKTTLNRPYSAPANGLYLSKIEY